MTEFLGGRVTLLEGDCLELLGKLKPNSVDSVVVDPPYHLQSIVKRFAKTGRTDKTRTSSGPHQRTANGFMNKVWDGGDIAFRKATWKKVLRVLKPGGYIVAFGSSRTFGRMSVAIEDAGFINQPMHGWIFGQGFPKAHRVHAEGWEGWRYGGQATKPALEPIYMGQKPFSEKTGTANVVKWGTGALNIDGCRVGTERPASHADPTKFKAWKETDGVDRSDSNHADERIDIGRWPANVITDGSAEVIAAFPDAPGQQADASLSGEAREGQMVYGAMKRGRGSEPSADSANAGDVGFKMRPGERRDDSGSAARFFYAAKADPDDRLGSKHPTVKPLDLIQYLVRLVTPPGGTVLNCFAGTGTTGEAAWREGFKAILMEAEPEYWSDIARRMELAENPTKRAAVAASKNKLQGAEGTPLFGDVA